MKPVCLEMTAFGSYAKHTVIPFSELRHNLYLVTGDTGAGKTTIFDAIMFALYGVASGSDRTSKTLHCDRADKSTDTVVKLTFLHMGGTYAVQRSIRFQKKRGGESQYSEVLDATLWEPGRDPIKGHVKVRDRCRELLGMDADQFRKIIMLAQGEFRGFLKANSKEKDEILGKLFDNSDFLYFQNLLSGARKRLDDERQGRRGELDALLSPDRLTLPEGASREPYLAEQEDLLENLAALVREDETRREALRKERDDAQGQLNRLNTEKGAAEQINRLFEELWSREERLRALLNQEQAMEERREALERAERALHQALPAVTECRRAETELAETRKEIIRLESLLESQEEALSAAQKLADGDAESVKRLSDIERTVRAIEEELPRHSDLARKAEEQREAEAAADAAQKDAAEREKRCQELAESLKTLQAELDGLDGADAEAVALKQAYQDAQKKSAGLAGDDGIREGVRKVQEQERRLSGEEETLRRYAQEALEAENHAHNLYQRFLAGQAGLLAEGLRKAVETDGEACCPVCGSSVRREGLSLFAPLTAETPSQDEEEAAREQAAKLERRRSEKDMDVKRLRDRIADAQKSLVRRAAEWLSDCDGWDALVSEGYLSGAVADARNAEREAKAAWENAVQRTERAARLKTELSSQREALENAQERREQSMAIEREERTKANAAESEAKGIRKGLAYADETEAKTEREKLRKERDALTARIKAHTEARDEARRQRDTTSGNLSGKRDRIGALEAALTDALTRQNAVLEKNAFASPEAVEQSLFPMGDTEPETWLKRERKACEEYDADLKNTRERIEELKEQTAEKRHTDMAELSEKISEAERASGKAEGELRQRESLHENHTAILKKAGELKRTLGATEQAWARLDKLASLAVGENAEGGKLKFDAYVMGAVFREILEMANQRLDIMSGGRYELVHRVQASRANSVAGLDIEALDIISGQRRPSETLSGGEAFFTSLALALGLSDVAQNRAGGQRMDALFIDEGFGSLSDGVLDKALNVLNQLTEGDRLVGVISHLDKLSESIPQKIRVVNDGGGSSATLEFA